MRLKKSGSTKGCLLVLISLLSFAAESQQKKSHRNYVSALGVYDATNISIAGALEYERWMLIKRKWVLSAKADYVFPHKTFNLFWPADDLSKSNRQFCLMVSGYFFSTAKNDHQGFFVGTSAGLNYTQYQAEVYSDNTGHGFEKRAVISPGCEVFVGGQVNFKRGGSFKFTTGAYNFYPKRKDEYPENLPIVLLYTKVSFGF